MTVEYVRVSVRVGLLRKFVWLPLLVMMVTAGCGGFTYHRVQPGDTLYSISWRYGLDYREVAGWNHITPPYTIYNGQLLRVTPPTRPDRKIASIPSARTVAPVVNAPAVSAIRPQPATSATAAIKWQWPAQGRLQQTFSKTDVGRKGIDI